MPALAHEPPKMNYANFLNDGKLKVCQTFTFVFPCSRLTRRLVERLHRRHSYLHHPRYVYDVDEPT